MSACHSTDHSNLGDQEIFSNKYNVLRTLSLVYDCIRYLVSNSSYSESSGEPLRVLFPDSDGISETENHADLESDEIESDRKIFVHSGRNLSNVDKYWIDFRNKLYQEIIDDLEGKEYLFDFQGEKFSTPHVLVLGHSYNKMCKFEDARDTYRLILKFLESKFKLLDEGKIIKGTVYKHIGFSYQMEGLRKEKGQKLRILKCAYDSYHDAVKIFEKLKNNLIVGSPSSSKSHEMMMERYWNAKILQTCCEDEIRYVDGKNLLLEEFKRFMEKDDCPKDRLLLHASVHYLHRKEYDHVIQLYECFLSNVSSCREGEKSDDSLLEKYSYQKSLFQIAYAYNKLGEYRCALEIYLRLKSHLEKSPDQYVQGSLEKQLGWTYQCLGEYDRSHAAYKNAVELNHNDHVAWFRKGVLEAFLIRNQNFADAIYSFSKASKSKHNKRALLWKYVLQISQSTSEQPSGTELEEALNSNELGISETTKDELRRILYNQDNTNERHDPDLNQAENESDPYVLSLNALLFLRSGLRDKAKMYSDRACLTDPSNMLSHAIRKFINDSIEKISTKLHSHMDSFARENFSAACASLSLSEYQSNRLHSFLDFVETFSRVVQADPEVSYVACDLVWNKDESITLLVICEEKDAKRVQLQIDTLCRDQGVEPGNFKDDIIFFTPNSVCPEDEDGFYENRWYQFEQSMRRMNVKMDETSCCEKEFIQSQLTDLLVFPRIQFVSYNEKRRRIDIGMIAYDFPSILPEFIEKMNRIFQHCLGGIRVFVQNCWFCEDCLHEEDGIMGCFDPMDVNFSKHAGSVDMDQLSVVAHDGSIRDFPDRILILNPYSMIGGVRNTPFRIRPGTAIGVTISGGPSIKVFTLGAFVDRDGNVVSPEQFNAHKHFGVSCFHVDLSEEDCEQSLVYCMSLRETEPNFAYQLSRGDEIASTKFSKNRGSDYQPPMGTSHESKSFPPLCDYTEPMINTIDVSLIQFLDTISPDKFHPTVARCEYLENDLDKHFPKQSNNVTLRSFEVDINQYRTGEVFYYSGYRTGHGVLRLQSPLAAISSYSSDNLVKNGDKFIFLGYAKNHTYWYGYWFYGLCRHGDSGAAIYHESTGNVIGLLKAEIKVNNDYVFAVPFSSVSECIREYFSE